MKQSEPLKPVEWVGSSKTDLIAFPVDVRSIPSGLYYYRLTSGPYGAVRMMTVAK